jgi:uncharacterized protein
MSMAQPLAEASNGARYRLLTVGTLAMLTHLLTGWHRPIACVRQVISSVLTEIESFRALARYAPEAVSRLPAVLDLIDLINLDPPIRILAQTVRPATVRSLDAIHLGTALHTRPALTSFVTYDKRLLDAAMSAGLPADSPV